MYPAPLVLGVSRFASAKMPSSAVDVSCPLLAAEGPVAARKRVNRR